MKSKAFRSAFPHTLPVMAGYLFLGMGFGILLESNGYSFIWAFFMSIFIYAGSMQYVAIDLLASGASLISTAIMTLMIQVRHLFYGLSIIDKYKDTGKKKLLLIHELTMRPILWLLQPRFRTVWTRDGSICLSPCWITFTGSSAARSVHSLVPWSTSIQKVWILS